MIASILVVVLPIAISGIFLIWMWLGLPLSGHVLNYLLLVVVSPIAILGLFTEGMWLGTSKIKWLPELPAESRFRPIIGSGLILPSVVFFLINIVHAVYSVFVLHSRYQNAGLLAAATFLVVAAVGLTLVLPHKSKLSTFAIIFGSECIAIFLMGITCAACDFAAIGFFLFLLGLGPIVLLGSSILAFVSRFIYVSMSQEQPDIRK